MGEQVASDFIGEGNSAGADEDLSIGETQGRTFEEGDFFGKIAGAIGAENDGRVAAEGTAKATLRLAISATEI